MELLLVTARHLNVLKQVPACTTRETRMVAIVTSNHGKDNPQALQLPGSKNDSIVMTMDRATKVDLQLLHGQVAIVVATATAAMVVLLAAALPHGSNRRLPRRLLSVNLAMAMVGILAMIKALVMEHLQRQLRQVSALSCNNMLVHLHLHQVMGPHHLHHPTTLLRPHHLLITLHHRHHRDWSYDAFVISRKEDG
jgi:hypothetical protein